MTELDENNFVAGTSYEPLLNGKTRVRTFARGGRLISDKVMSDEEAIELMRQRIQVQAVSPDVDKKEAH